MKSKTTFAEGRLTFRNGAQKCAKLKAKDGQTFVLSKPVTFGLYHYSCSSVDLPCGELMMRCDPGCSSK